MFIRKNNITACFLFLAGLTLAQIKFQLPRHQLVFIRLQSNTGTQELKGKYTYDESTKSRMMNVMYQRVNHACIYVTVARTSRSFFPRCCVTKQISSQDNNVKLRQLGQVRQMRHDCIMNGTIFSLSHNLSISKNCVTIDQFR